MKKVSKLLVIAIAFALAFTMIPFGGSAYAADTVTEVSSVNLTAGTLLCGTKIGNGDLPQPQMPELTSAFAGKSVNRAPASDEQLPDITAPDDAYYFVADAGWLVEDPDGWQGYSMMEEPTTAKGGEKYYFYAYVVAGKIVQTSDGSTWEQALFSDNATVNVTGGKIVWKQFYAYEIRDEEPAVDEAMKVVEEADVTDEDIVEEEDEAYEDVAEEEEEEAEEDVDEPAESTSNNYYAVEVVIEVEAEHVPGETVVENNVEPTATTDGHYDNVVYCDICGDEISRETVTVPATGENNNNNGVPPTGDEARLLGWMMLMAAAAAACVGIKATDRK